MPWTTDEDSLRHNKKAKGELGDLWRKVANETLERTNDEGRAIREANAVIGRVHDAPTETQNTSEHRPPDEHPSDA